MLFGQSPAPVPQHGRGTGYGRGSGCCLALFVQHPPLRSPAPAGAAEHLSGLLAAARCRQRPPPRRQRWKAQPVNAGRGGVMEWKWGSGLRRGSAGVKPEPAERSWWGWCSCCAACLPACALPALCLRSACALPACCLHADRALPAPCLHAACPLPACPPCAASGRGGEMLAVQRGGGSRSGLASGRPPFPFVCTFCSPFSPSASFRRSCRFT